MVNSQEEKEKVETLAKKAKDIKRVANDLVVFKASMTGV
jgi:ribosomal protein L17